MSRYALNAINLQYLNNFFLIIKTFFFKMAQIDSLLIFSVLSIAAIRFVRKTFFKQFV